MAQTISFTIDDSTRLALIKTLGGHALSPETVAARLLHQFAHAAPPEIATFIAYEGSIHANMWNDFGLSERNKERANLAPELNLVEAIRNVIAKRP